MTASTLEILISHLHMTPRSASWGEYSFGKLPEMPEIFSLPELTSVSLYEMPEESGKMICRHSHMRIRLRSYDMGSALTALSSLPICGDLLAEERLAPLVLTPLSEDPAVGILTFPRAVLLPDFRLQCASESEPEGWILTFAALPDPENGAIFSLTKC